MDQINKAQETVSPVELPNQVGADVIHEESVSKFEVSLSMLGNQPTTLSKKWEELWALRLLTTIYL